MPTVNFFTEDISFAVPVPRKTAAWIKACISREEKSLKQLNFIFCSDQYLLQKNIEYLSHKTLTDVITFDNSEDNVSVEGDIFISVERIADNAKKLQLSFRDELDRVMIHGILHLIGYGDKTPRAKAQMRKKEDACLSLRSWVR